MASLGIGERLRTARQALGLSLEEVETATRIRLSYLDALEREEFTALPNPAYVKGFLRNYAAYLGIPADELLQAYPRDTSSGTAAAAPVIRHESPIDVVIKPATPYSPTRQLLTIIGLAVGVGILIVVYVFFSQVREFSRTPPASSRKAPAPGEQPALAPAGQPPQTTSAAPSVQPPAPPPSAQPPSAIPAPKTPASPPTSTAAPATPAAPQQSSAPPPYPPAGPSQTGPPPAGALQVAVAATDRSWVRAVADGTVVFEGFVEAGGKQAWGAARQITVKVGNAGAVEVTVNGRSLGPMGKPGAVIEKTFQAGETPAP